MDDNQNLPPPSPCEHTHDHTHESDKKKIGIDENPDSIFHNCSVTPNMRIKMPVNKHTGEMGVSNSDWSDNEGVETGNFNVYKSRNRPLKKSPEEIRQDEIKR